MTEHFLSNYTNSIAGTPLDEAVQRDAWRKPVIKPPHME